MSTRILEVGLCGPALELQGLTAPYPRSRVRRTGHHLLELRQCDHRTHLNRQETEGRAARDRELHTLGNLDTEKPQRNHEAIASGLREPE